MKAKTFLILILVLLGIAGLTGLILGLRAPKQADVAMGEKLFPDFNVNGVALIKVDSPQESFSVERTDKGWIVREREYSADFSKVSRFLKKFEDLEVGRAFEGDKKVRERLKLLRPGEDGPREARGIYFELFDEAQKPVAQILAGKDRSSKNTEYPYPTGQYVLLEEGGKIFLAAPFFENLDQTPGQWLKTTLMRLPAKDVMEIACYKKKGAKFIEEYALARPEREQDFEPVSFPIAADLKEHAVNRMADALSSLAMDDLEKEEEGKGPVFDAYLEYRMYDGTICRVYKAPAGPDGCKVRLEAAYEKPTAKSEIANQDQLDKAAEEAALALNRKLAKWIFTLPKWRCDTLVVDPAELAEKEEATPNWPAMPEGLQ